MKRLFITAVALLCASVPGQAQAPAQGLPPALQVHLDSEHVVTLEDGRKIQLVCMGQGSPTIILAAGSGAPSVQWFGIQPVLAQQTRVCSWSRAGYGLSSPSPLPQTVHNRLNDLEAALERRGIAGPFIFAGASLGAYESVLFADRHPSQAVGLVLIDPSIPEQASREDRVSPDFSAGVQRSVRTQVMALVRCAAGLRAGTIGPGKPDPNGCFVPPIPSTAPEPIRRAFATITADAETFETQASLLSSADIDGVLIASPVRNYGNMPLIVLAAGEMMPKPASQTDSTWAQYPAFYQEFRKGGAEYAALSSRGVQRIVEGSSHDIPAMNPQAVTEAIFEVLAQAR